MNLDMTFEESNQHIDVKFGEIQTASDGGFERGYEEGYSKGNKEGYAEGYGEAQEETASLFGIQNEVTGTSIVTCDYVNENEHNVEVKLSSDTVTDFSDKVVRVCGKNFLPSDDIKRGLFAEANGTLATGGNYGDLYRSFILNLVQGTYTISCKKEPELKFVRKIENGTLTTISGYPSGGKYTFDTDGGIVGFTFAKQNGSNWDDDLLVQVEYGNNATPHEEYIEPIEYTPNADGTLEVESVSTTMNIICEGADISAKYYCVPNVEWHRFWDVTQNFGNKTDYSFSFCGIGWKKSNFKPKYSIIPLNIGYMFRDSCSDKTTENEMISMLELEKELDIIFDFSSCTNFDTAFRSSLFKEINVVDLKSTKKVNYTFYSTISKNNQTSFGAGLKRIERLVVHENIVFENTTFNSNYILEYVGFEGVIANSITLQWSELLNVESAKKLLLCLKNYKGTSNDMVNTVSLHANVWNALALEGNASPNGNTWEDYLLDIGWTKL